MNRSKIEWCDHTWNPITGCLHGCEYCYARRISHRFSGDVRLNKTAEHDYQIQDAADGQGKVFILKNPMLNETGHPLVYPFGFEPTLHLYRMDTLDSLKMGNNIFVGAMADIFGSWVPDEWIQEVMGICVERPQHNYLFLTKNPERYIELEKDKRLPWADNFWFGSSVTKLQDRYAWFDEKKFHWYLSVEPIMEDFGQMDAAAPKPEWVIVGAETGQRKDKIVPERHWIENLLEECRKYDIPLFMKSSLEEIWGEQLIQEFPEQLRHSEISPKLKKKLYDICSVCKGYLKKNEMIALLARPKRGIQPKQFGFMCRKCFGNFCSGMELEVPDFKMEDE